MKISDRHIDIDHVLLSTLTWSKRQNYRGYNKHDGLNSPVLRLLLGWGRWPRMFAIQGVMRAPLNIRPLLLTPKTYNPKGLALFLQAWLNLYKKTGNKEYLQEACDLFNLLQSMCSPGKWSGDCWGYHYTWQDPGFCAPTNTPNAVVTSFVCESFLDLYRATLDRQYLDAVGRCIPFFTGDLTLLKDEPEELCLAYMPLPMTMRVMDVSILIGSVIAQYVELSGQSQHQSTATRLVNYVAQQQTGEGAWFYTDPPSASHIRHDNYHTGFILDALWRYMAASNNYRWKPRYDRGLEFYARHLFNADGSPRWMSDCNYPYDIHGSAQGMITFARHTDQYPELATTIARWAIENMYHTEGRFYYQKNRYFTKRFTLLRWCNGWMSRALSTLSITNE